MVSTIAKDLAGAREGSALVLDDCHEIECGRVHEVVSYLSVNLPSGVVLVMYPVVECGRPPCDGPQATQPPPRLRG